MGIGDSGAGDLAALEEQIRLRLVAGFWDYLDLLQWVSDSEVLRPDDAAMLVGSMWDERVAEQAAWLDTGLRSVEGHVHSAGIGGHPRSDVLLLLHDLWHQRDR